MQSFNQNLFSIPKTIFYVYAAVHGTLLSSIIYAVYKIIKALLFLFNFSRSHFGDALSCFLSLSKSENAALMSIK